MKILDKIQGLPDKRKKIIVWVVLIITAVFLFKLYVQNMQEKMKNIEGEKIKQELQIPKLQEELKGLLEFEIPEIK
ncbi:MAG: hypothetical protein ACKKMR_03065 [Candidatus Nealsonbacteria bacterium]